MTRPARLAVALRSMAAPVALAAAAGLAIAGCQGAPNRPLPTTATTSDPGAGFPTSAPTTSIPDLGAPSLGDVAPGTSATGAPSAPGGAVAGEAGRLSSAAAGFVAAASSVRAVGTLNVQGAPMTFDLRGTRDGLSVRGTVSMGVSAPFELLRSEGRTFVRSTALTGGARGRYVQLSGAAANQLAVLSISDMLDAFEGAVRAATGRNSVGRTSYEGTQAYELRSGGATTAIVAADGSGRLLRLSSSAPRTAGTVTFSEWDAVPRIVPPAIRDVAPVPGA